MEETLKIKQINNNMKHFHKINIFGEPDVGKTNLISLFEHFNDDDFKIEVNSGRNSSFNELSSLVEQIKKIELKLNEERSLNLNIYETNINRYDLVKMNLDTLLVQTECIIIMFDNSSKNTFDNIPDLFSTIKATLKNKEVPIFLLQNKMDLNVNESQIDEEEAFNSSLEKFKNKNPNIIHKKISLINKNDFINFLLEFDQNIDQDDNKNNNNIVNSIRLKYPFNKDVPNCEQKLTISLLGDSSTGKTTFLNKLIGNDNNNTKATIALDFYEILGEINNEKVKIRIYDTAGQETYRSLSNSLYQVSHGFLLFFDVTNKDSFESLNYWIRTIKEKSKYYNENNNSIILIANKNDESEGRQIPKNIASKYATENKLKYFECSSKNGLNVLEIFNEIIFTSYYLHKEIGEDDEAIENDNNKVNKDNKDNKEDKEDNKNNNYNNEDVIGRKSSHSQNVNIVIKKENERKGCCLGIF